MKSGFTLIEMIITVIIIGILATFAVPQYIATQEKALDKEAQANLVLIQAAENLYKIESGVFLGATSATAHADLSTNLQIALPPAGGKWNYTATRTAAAGANPEKLCAQAARNQDSGRTWTLMDTCAAPKLSAACTCP